MKRNIYAFITLCELLNMQLVYGVNGSVSVKYGHVICTNDAVSGNDINEIGMPCRYNASTLINLMGSVGDINIIFTLAGLFNAEKHVYLQQNELFPDDTSRALKAYEYLPNNFIQQLNCNISKGDMKANLGNFSVKSHSLVLPSKALWGGDFYYKKNLDTGNKLKLADIHPFIQNIENPYAPKKYNLMEHIEVQRKAPKSFIDFNAFGGLSAFRHFTFSESLSNDAFNTDDNTGQDILDNDIFDPSYSAKQTEFTYGAAMNMRLKIFGFAAAAAGNHDSDQYMSGISTAFPATAPYAKQTVGGTVSAYLLREIIAGHLHAGYSRYNTNVAAAGSLYATAASGKYITVIDTGGYNGEISVIYAQEGYQDASGIDAAESDKMGIEANNVINISEKAGSINIIASYNRDNAFEIDSLSDFSSIPDEAQNPTDNIKHAVNGTITHAKDFKKFRTGLTFSAGYNNYKTVDDISDINFNISDITINPGQQTNTNAASAVTPITNFKYDAGIKLTGISVKNFNFSPEVKGTYYLDKVSAAENYYLVNPQFKISAAFLEKRLNADISPQYNYQSFPKKENLTSFSLPLTLKFKALPGKLDIGLKGSFAYGLDKQGAAEATSGITTYSYKYKTSVYQWTVVPSCNFIINSKLSAEFRFVYSHQHSVYEYLTGADKSADTALNLNTIQKSSDSTSKYNACLIELGINMLF